MKYIFLIAAFNAFFFAILLFQKKTKALHDRILVFWLVYLGLYTGVYGLYSSELFTNFPLLSVSFISLLTLHGPFLYLYISSLAKNSNKFKSKDLLHFTPFVLFNIYLIISSFFPLISNRISLNHVIREHGSPLIFQLFLILTVLSGPLYFVLSTRLFKQLDSNIANNFSFSENIDLDWLRKLVYSFGLVWTLLMIVATIHHVFHLFSWIFCTDGIFLSLSIFIILIGYFGLKQKEIFSHSEKESFVMEQKPEKYSGSGLKKEDSEEYLLRLNQYMDTKKPYLNPDINLPQLSKDLNIPSHYLSQVINENIGLNFFDFINRYRVEEIKSKIIDPKYTNYSILGIAFESGFNSKSAFNRVFKNSTGITPSEYKKNVSV